MSSWAIWGSEEIKLVVDRDKSQAIGAQAKLLLPLRAKVSSNSKLRLDVPKKCTLGCGQRLRTWLALLLRHIMKTTTKAVVIKTRLLTYVSRIFKFFLFLFLVFDWVLLLENTPDPL